MCYDSEWFHFYLHIAPLLRSFALEVGIVLDPYPKEAPHCVFKFAHPNCGVGTIYVSKKDANTVELENEWFFDCYESDRRLIHPLRVVTLPTSSNHLREVLLESVRLMCSWGIDRLRPIPESPKHGWQRKWTREQFEAGQLVYPIPRLSMGEQQLVIPEQRVATKDRTFASQDLVFAGPRMYEEPSWLQLYAQIAPVLRSFAIKAGIVFNPFPKEAPCCLFEFSHPRGGVGIIFVSQVNSNEVRITDAWQFDSYNKDERLSHPSNMVNIEAPFQDLSQLLRESIDRICSWKIENLEGGLDPIRQGWNNQYSKTEFEATQFVYPLPRFP